MRQSHIKRLAYSFASFTIVATATFLSITALKGSPSPQEMTISTPNLGKTIYQVHCAPCHGSDGKGDGFAASELNPGPRDFTSGKYKFRSTKSGSIPTDDNLKQVINNGLHGTSMPGWKEFISGDSLEAIVTYIKSLSPRFQSEQASTVTVSDPIPVSEKSIAAGKEAYDKLQCGECHGADGTVKGITATDLADDWGNPVMPANLTESWTFRTGSSPADIYLRLKTGIDGSPMPSYEGMASEQDLWNVANYVSSISRKPVWNMNPVELQQYYASLESSHKSNPVERGKYLVAVFGCDQCHSPADGDRKLMTQYRMAGGQKWTIGPYGDFYTPNLTSDKETGLGNWTDEQLRNALTKGIRKDGSRALPFPMPWTAYASLSNDDLNALIAYLRTIPPVYNKIPEPNQPNIFSYLWGKFEMLILKNDHPLVVYPGNAGTTKSTSNVESTHPSIASTTGKKENEQ